MTGDSVLFERADGVAVLTLNRPSAKNAIDIPTTDALVAALRGLRAADDIRAVVLAGAGGDFCAGGDVKGMADGASRTVEQRRAGMARYAELARALASLDKPLIAAVDGVAFGAGLSMALYADIVLVSTRAPSHGVPSHRPRARCRCLVPVATCGGVAACQGTDLFGPRVRCRRGGAHEHRAGGSRAGGPDAARNGTGPQSRGCIADGIQPLKRALAATLQSDLETMLDMEASSQAIALSSAYFREAIRRFAAKEPAQFCWPNKD